MPLSTFREDRTILSQNRGRKLSPKMVGSIILFLAAWVLLTLSSIPLSPSLERLRQFELGDPAPETVFAPFTYKIVDKVETERSRAEKQESVNPTFTRVTGVGDRAKAKWDALARVATSKNPKFWRDLADEQIEEVSREALSFWDGLSKEEKGFFELRVKDPVWARRTFSDISKPLADWDILLDQSRVNKLRPSGERVPVSWKLKDLDGATKLRLSGVSVYSVTEQEKSLFTELADSEQSAGLVGQSLSKKLAEWFIVPTLEYDAAATKADRDLAAASVPSVSIEISQGQILVRRGDTVTEEDKWELTGLMQQTESRLGGVLGRALLIGAILWMFFGYLLRYQPDLLEDYPRLASCLGQMTLIAWIGFVVAWGSNALEVADLSVGYIIPVASIGILMTLLENSRLGYFSVIVTTFLIGTQFHWDFTDLLALGITGAVGVYHVSGANLRSQIYLAFPWILGVGIILATGVHLVENPSWQAFSSTLTLYSWGWLWLAVNGFLSVGISLLLLPLLEDMLGVTTEFKLRELSVSHPLLRRLEEVAPGTYYHSLNVSVLAESAAAAIGANALLVKVAAYYHDIGKMEKPTYFAENQFTEEDKKKHSKISPHMSCLIIRNHVKIGLEMAREHRLPEALLPFIGEHHGTTLISYFYDMARNEDPHGTVTESDFRYLGPKPQTIESAVLMIADTIEAASRSMKLVGEGEIRIFVKRMINDKMIDGQFDECPLTFKELHILSESFTRSLKTMMHRRIAYPSTPEIQLAGKSEEKKNVQELFTGESARTTAT